MDLTRIAVRAILTYGFLLLLLRLAGKRTIRQANAFDFVLALIVGDLTDDVLWAEVPMAQFVVAAGALVVAKLSVALSVMRRGARV